jgi:hypothetical protein
VMKLYTVSLSSMAKVMTFPANWARSGLKTSSSVLCSAISPAYVSCLAFSVGCGGCRGGNAEVPFLTWRDEPC